ncbi:MAG: hypothetical protein AVDCRST_MAG87-915 [uncultured Thermomicrobiales bacterium]|uniref:Uncharacterized protein n=1 Tax=uncultured Thermomicrobiales bacterium TaxID=1645740 RepID=A0A6J4UK64_9BACT|nr:MAG: hypothetical protein AVDCRST_MAG87-915 [uncultured Thermomicrobiales bacterium]
MLGKTQSSPPDKAPNASSGTHPSEEARAKNALVVKTPWALARPTAFRGVTEKCRGALVG